MKKMLIFGVVSLLFVSCKNGSGLFSVEKDITLKGKKGKSISYEAGKYDATLNYKVKLFKKNVVELEVDGKSDAIFVIPKKFKINQNHMNTVLKAKDVKQDHDVKIDVDTHYTNSTPVFDNEYCSETRRYKACYINEEGKKKFKTKSFVLSGEQKVQFHYLYKNKLIDLTLMEEGSGEVVALFSGSDKSSSKVYDFKGPCRFRSYKIREFRELKRKARHCK